MSVKELEEALAAKELMDKEAELAQSMHQYSIDENGHNISNGIGVEWEVILYLYNQFKSQEF